MSLLNLALEQRKASAHTLLSGKMNPQRAVMWMLIRNLRGAVQGLVPGFAPDYVDNADLKMVKVEAAGLQAKAASDGERS